MNWSTSYDSAGGGRRRMPRRGRASDGTIAKKLMFTALTLSLLVATVGMGTWAAFSDTTVNTGNSFDTGSITLTDNDGGSALLALTAAGPGATDDGCIEVEYDSTVGNAQVRLFGEVNGTVDADLSPYLTLVVTRGEANAPCSAMGATEVLFNGTLDTFPAAWTSGVGGGSPTVLEWADGDTYAYNFVVSLSSDNAAQGKGASAGFTWEARTV